MLRLPDAWVWDFWLLDDGETYHMFFLYASRAIGDPEGRHFRASVGHAVSRDLVSWERVVDALVRSDPPAADDLATWTGSTVRGPDGLWYLFYTCATLTPGGNVQSIGCATSADLYTWHKRSDNPVLQADSRWYEKLEDGMWFDEAFRDPWVMPDPAGDGWHMLITARANHGARDDRGVVGHATSPDLSTWQLGPPLNEPGQGFAYLEVAQIVELDGQHLLMFSALAKDMSDQRRVGTTGGVWVARAESPTGPYDLANAQQVTDDSLYVGKLIRDRASGDWMFLAFRNDSPDGFVGEIPDPRRASWDGRRLNLEPAVATVGG